MFPENLVQACFQQIHTVYKLKKSKNSTAEAAQLTTPAGYEEYDYYEHDHYGPFREYQTTAASRNLSGVADDAWKGRQEYTDGMNVLG